MVKPLVVVVLVLLALPIVSAADAYKPYLHAPTIPSSPGVRLFGQYNTLLFPGAATYTYPVEVPPGTHGLQPSIVLAYNSQSAQQRPGILGAGWSTNQNYIYRDVNSTPDDTSDDKFLLVFQNNVYELVWGSQDGQWHTEVDYHFRLQNQTTSTNNDSLYWTLTTTDGTQYRFGHNPDSERTSNTGRPYALKWYLDQVTDPFGNTINYHYVQDPNPEDTGTTYLASISYDSDQRRNITFAYESSARPDQRVAYEQGNKVSESRRLTDISVLANGLLVRRYHLNYTLLSQSLSALASITRLGADNNSVLHTITFNYYPPVPGYTQTSQWALPVAFDNASGADAGVRLVDVNNDGFADILQGQQRTGTKQAWLNNQAGNWTPSPAWAPPVYFVDNSGNDTGVRFADVNNDGLTDILVSKAGSSQVWLNNGTGWTLSNWTIPVDFVDASGADQGVILTDLDGDGRVDIVRAKVGLPTLVYINNGAGWTNKTSTWNVPVFFNNGTDTGARLIDINGDGLPDIVQANGTGRTVWLNNGAGWTLTNWTVPVDFTNQTYTDTGVRFLDVDGDGLPDLVQNLASGTTVINNTWLNNGTGWVLNNSWTTPSALVSNKANVGRRLADLDADNAPDFLASTNGTLQNAWIKNHSTPYLLSAITNEYGGTVTINYTPSTQYNNTDQNGAGTVGFSIPVVNSILKNNSMPGTQGVLGRSNYSYFGGLYNYTKREFRGFSTTTEQTPAALVKHYFLQDTARRGKEYTTEVYALNGSLFSRTVKNYNYTLWYGVYNLTLQSTTNYQYDGASTPRVTNTSYVYDWYGNPLSIDEQGDPSITTDDRVTNFTYAYSTNNWILDHVADQATCDSTGAKVKETISYYDNRGITGIGSTGSLTRREEWNNVGNNTVTTYAYDTYGNPLTVTDSAGSTTAYNYDATHTYLVSSIDALGHITYYAYDLGTGNLLLSK